MVDQTALQRLEDSPTTLDGWEGRPAQSYWSESWERLRHNRFGIFFGLVLVLMALIAVAAPLVARSLTHVEPGSQDLHDVFGSFSSHHLLGSDELGRDELTRLVYGAQVSLGVGFLTVVFYILIGATVGIAAGYYGGVIDDVLMRFVDILLSIPALYLLILITDLLPLPIGPAHHPWVIVKHDAVSLSFIIAITAWGGVARLVRGEVLSLRGRDFMMATTSLGASDFRLMSRHLLPNVLPVMIVTASLGVGQIILLEAVLDFIGLGVQPPTASWGNMLLNSQSYFTHSVLLVYLPGLAILVAVLSANIFGNAVRDAFDPRLK